MLKMAEGKGQKRPFDLNTVLDDSLQFATWDSDSELNSSPAKKPRLLDDGSSDGELADKKQQGDVVSDTLQNLQHQNSCCMRLGDSSAAEEQRVNGKSEECETVTETSGNKMISNTTNGLNHEVECKLTYDKDDSPGTVVLSDDEHAKVEEKDENLTRIPTVEQGDVEQNKESSTAVSPACARTLWKDTSIETDAVILLTIIPQADLTAIMECLAKHRANPDRLNIVVTEMLDRASQAVAGRSDDHHRTVLTSDPHGDQRARTNSSGDDQRGLCHQPPQDQSAVKIHTNERPSTAHASDDCKIVNNTTVPVEKKGAAGPSSDSGVAKGHQGDDEDATNLYNDVKNVIEKVKRLYPQARVNATEVYLLLIQHADQAGRADLVINTLLQKYGASSSTQDQDFSSPDDIFNQAMKLNSEFPHINPSEIYELLENEENRANILQAVREKLQARAGVSDVVVINSPAKPSLPKDDSISNDPLVRNDPVFRDMRIISKMFPEKDQNELYALVEAHYYKADRVQVVIEELLKQERNSQDNSQSLPHPQYPVHMETESPVTGANAALGVAEYLLHAEVDHLRDIFPDCDPNYIFERLEAHKQIADRVKVIAAEMFERKDYPRLRDVQEKQTKAARKRHLQGMEFTLEEFLAKFPEPGNTFNATTKEMKEGYRNHVDVQLKHDFPDFRNSYVTKVVEKHHHHLLPIVRELEAMRAEILAYGGRSKKLRDVPKEVPLTYPEEPDEYFFCELWYTMNEEKVNQHFKEKTALRQTRVEEARAKKELYECQCCFEDECLFEEMNACADGHLFCQECIARSAEAAFGEGKTTFPCLSGTCEHQIPLSVLKELLPSSMFSKMLRKMQEEEVRQAGITDLVECPFCSFATIMSDPNDRVFRCLNPECLRDSCRLCREPNHVPLKCEEVEKQNETDMRTFIEKRVTEAMLRKCHRCGKHFVKDVGCNKMTCICGATSCYVCREPGIDYSHFDGSRCTEQDMNRLHQQEMQQAEQKARQEYLHLHPEAANIDLKYDPGQLIQHGNEQHNMNNNYDDDDYDDDEVDGSISSDSDSSDTDLDSSDDTDSDDAHNFQDPGMEGLMIRWMLENRGQCFR